jgi:hypothetical protein
VKPFGLEAETLVTIKAGVFRRQEEFALFQKCGLYRTRYLPCDKNDTFLNLGCLLYASAGARLIAFSSCRES